MPDSVFGRLGYFFASLSLAVILTVVTSINVVYAEGTDSSAENNNNSTNLAFSLNSVTLTASDMSANSVELSSSIISAESTEFHLLTPQFIEELAIEDASNQDVTPGFIIGQVYAATSSNNSNNAIVGNYNYIYEDAISAEDVLARVKLLIETDGLVTVPEYTSDSQVAFKLTGAEDDSMYWYISVNDNLLNALSVNGFSDGETFQTFQAFVSKVTQKEMLNASGNIYLPLIQSPPDSGMKSLQAAWRGPAYQVAYTHSSGWRDLIPHYGAWFIGKNGRSQYFNCFWEPSGYRFWNWWSSDRNVLLLEKRWLASGPNAWNPGCHYAVMER